MKVRYFTHSLLSCWNHGNAHFLRGVLAELVGRGHDVEALEPEGNWSLTNLLGDAGPAGLGAFRQSYPDLAPVTYVNPEIVWASTEQAVLEERCLSIPDTPRRVGRPAHVRVRYRDRDGIERTDDMSGMLAMVVQHEIDHLNGVLILDHVPPDASTSG